MAVVKTLSAVLTNRDATPPVLNANSARGGVLKSGFGSVAVGAADSATSYYPLVEVPSNAVIRGVLVSAVAGMTTLAGNIGVFKNTKNAAGVTTGVAANTGSDTIFASAQSLATVLKRSDVTQTSTTYSTDKMEQPLWQAIGLTSDPGGTFDIGIAVTTANTGAAGRVGIEVQYVDNGS